jgi:hypothetical protein
MRFTTSATFGQFTITNNKVSEKSLICAKRDLLRNNYHRIFEITLCGLGYIFRALKHPKSFYEAFPAKLTQKTDEIPVILITNAVRFMSTFDQHSMIVLENEYISIVSRIFEHHS